MYCFTANQHSSNLTTNFQILPPTLKITPLLTSFSRTLIITSRWKEGWEAQLVCMGLVLELMPTVSTFSFFMIFPETFYDVLEQVFVVGVSLTTVDGNKNIALQISTWNVNMQYWFDCCIVYLLYFRCMEMFDVVYHNLCLCFWIIIYRQAECNL